MELQVDVDEADVGQVQKGQAATFTVDAYPNRQFPATIDLVRFGSETVDNVVSYKTILNVDNDDLSLRPGMTATAEIVTAERENVLLVPNAALRFTPPKPAANAQPNSGGGLLASLLPRPPRPQATKSVTETPDKSAAQRVWVLRDGQPMAIPVTVGQSDGRMSEVTGADLAAGMPVITARLSATP
jgi:HlyD family secretion protein